MIDRMIKRKLLRELARAGIAAPSADNTQPWRLRLLDDGIEILSDKNQPPMFFDADGMATGIGCGALIENISITASTHGLTTDASYAGNHGTPLARLHFTLDADQQSNTLVSAIHKRQTERRLYRPGKPLPEMVLARLATALEAQPGFHLHRYDEPHLRNGIISLLTTTDRIRFNHPLVHVDFYDTLRFGTSAEQTHDGLAKHTLGIEPFFIPVLKFLRPWKRMHFFNRLGLHYVMALRGAWLPLKSAPHIVALSCQNETSDIDAGRQMERFWLSATLEGLSLQPFGALPLFLARLSRLDGEGFDAAQITTLRHLEARLHELTPSLDPMRERIFMLFRIGYPLGHSRPAYRRAVETFVIE